MKSAFVIHNGGSTHVPVVMETATERGDFVIPPHGWAVLDTRVEDFTADGNVHIARTKLSPADIAELDGRMCFVRQLV